MFWTILAFLAMKRMAIYIYTHLLFSSEVTILSELWFWKHINSRFYCSVPHCLSISAAHDSETTGVTSARKFPLWPWKPRQVLSQRNTYFGSFLQHKVWNHIKGQTGIQTVMATPFASLSVSAEVTLVTSLTSSKFVLYFFVLTLPCKNYVYTTSWCKSLWSCCELSCTFDF